MKVLLENMEFYARHGCFDLERKVGMRFLVDLQVETPENGAAAADDIEGVVDYLALYRVVKEQMELPSKVIENVAHRIVEAVYDAFPQIDEVTVKVSKVAPSLGGKVGLASVILTK